MNELLFFKETYLRKNQKMRVAEDFSHVELISPHRVVSLDYHEVKKLYWWLDYWMDDQKTKCSSCQHERSGCQYHDSDC